MNKKYFIIIFSMIAFLLAAIVLTGCSTKATSPAATETSGGSTATDATATPLPASTSTPPEATATPEPPAETAVEASPIPETASPTASPTATTTEMTETPTSPTTAEATTEVPTPVESAATATSESPATETTSACTDVAAFYKDVTVEDYTFFSQSEPFVKTWQVRNAGTCSWGTGYTIYFDSGFTFDAPDSSPLPSAAPGQIVDISLDMTAPNRGGQYMSRWRFKNADGKIFGVGLENGQLYTIINVGFINPTSSPSQPGNPSSGGNSQPTTVPGSSSGGSCNYSLDPNFSQQLVNIINQARQQAGLNTLNVQNQLAAAAQEHSIDIACHDSYDHLGSDGSLWSTRVARQGYANYNSARENIRVGDPAFGFSPQYVFDHWFESQVHHDNMYYPSVSDIGISCVINPDSEYKEFCTAVFARP